MSAILSPIFGAGAQVFNNQGIVLAGGKIYTYFAGTTTPLATWTTSTQSVQNANPIILDSAGRVPQEVWLLNGNAYKFVLTDSVGNTLGTWDNISGINSTTAILSEWLPGLTATYVNSTTFTTPGNNTSLYQTNRRIQYLVTSGTYYGTILTSTYDGVGTTTVTILPDTTAMDSSLSAVNYGFMSAVNTSIPVLYVTANNAVLTGTPICPTATVGANTTQIANCIFVNTAIANQAFLTALPSQPGNTKKTVITNGTNAAWQMPWNFYETERAIRFSRRNLAGLQ